MVTFLENGILTLDFVKFPSESVEIKVSGKNSGNGISQAGNSRSGAGYYFIEDNSVSSSGSVLGTTDSGALAVFIDDDDPSVIPAL
jgi:hypothetical protein